MSRFTPPSDYSRIKVVHSFEELAQTPLIDGVNALCWPRTLSGDFAEVVQHLQVERGITTLEDSRLEALPVSAAGKVAIEMMLEDQRRLRALDLAPCLDCVNGYVNDEDSGFVRTDVCSFHADSATVQADTWLCTYFGTSSEGLRNDEAQRRVDIPSTRAALLKLYGGEDDEGFLEYLNEHCYDLHYAPLPHARPFSFGIGNLWRIATEYPGSPVPPCIHRAPDPIPGQPPRLLLIS